MTGDKRPGRLARLYLGAACALLLTAVLLGPVPAIAASVPISPASLPAGTAGQAYKSIVSATGSLPFTWRATGLPTGLGLTSSSNGSATIAGKPATSGTFPVTLTVYDRNNNWGTAGFNLTVYPALTVPTVTLPDATVGSPYTYSFSGAGGGTGGYTWQAAGLPPGIGCTSQNGTATIGGTPLASGTFRITMTLADSANDETTTTFSLAVQPAVSISPTTWPAATVGTPYTVTFSAAGGTGNYTWWTSGLPPGLVCAPNGASATIHGTPSQYGLFSPIVSVQDQDGHGAGINRYLTVSYPSSDEASSSTPAADTNIGLVGPAGGTVATPDGSVSVSVPAGAFTGQSVVSIARLTVPYPAPDGFTPAGPSWNVSGATPVKPVDITIRYDPAVLGDLSPSRLGVYRHNPATGTWTWLPGTSNGDNTLTVSTLSMGVFAVQANTREFADLDQAPWARPAVDSLLGADMIGGMAPGRFAPLQDVTRAQFAVLLDRATKTAPAADGRTPFDDVPPTAWYAPYVAAAFDTDLMDGTGRTTFSPDTPVTREEMAVILARLPQTTSNTADLGQFSDASAIDPWAADAVAKVVGANLMTGFPDGTFGPLLPANRAETAVILCNYLGLNNQ